VRNKLTNIDINAQVNFFCFPCLLSSCEIDFFINGINLHLDFLKLLLLVLCIYGVWYGSLIFFIWFIIIF